MDQEESLLINVKEFIKEAKNLESNKSYNSAVTLYFKALAVLTDLLILKKEGFIPSNHTTRFKILKEKYLSIYRIFDKDFPIYQDSYRIHMTERHTKIIREDINEIAKLTGIKIDN